MNVFGLLLTVGGFAATLIQVARTKRATTLLKEEVGRIQLNIAKHDASHEASRAESALAYAKGHLQALEWLNVASNYEDFLSSVHILRELQMPEIAAFDLQIAAAQQYGVKLCERIGHAGHQGLESHEAVKISSSIRAHTQLISSIRIALQRSAFA